MKRTRWVFGAATLAGAVALAAPAVGQGKADSASLGWSRSRGGPAITYYDFGALHAPPRGSRWFTLGNVGRTKSGKLVITLSGSSAFSIVADRCTRLSIGRKVSCRVAVAYARSRPRANDHATLAAAGEHGVAARLMLYCSGAGHVYWVNSYNGTVNAVPVGGGRVTTLATGQANPSSVAVHGTQVYWVNDLPGGTVNEVPISGGRVTTLAAGQFSPASVAVDGTHVYWVNFGDFSGGGSVNEIPLGGGSVTTLATGQNQPDSVAVDGTHVYWTTGFYTVNEVPLGGGSVTKLASGSGAVAVDGTYVYFTANGSDVNEVPVGGGSVTTLASGQPNVGSLAVDGTRLYWTNAGNGYNGTVNEVPVGGGSVTTLATGQNQPGSVAVDGTHVYWVNHWIPGAVSAVPVGGGSVSLLATGQSGPVSIAVGP